MASAAIAAGAHQARALSGSGAVAAFMVGAVIFGSGGWAFALPLLTFFITSTLLSRWRRLSKEALGYEKGGRRDSGQVLANGGVAAVIALIYRPVLSARGVDLYPAYLAALAAANADTWATEIGSAIGGVPISLRTLKRARVGMSGAVSVAGTLGAFAGSAMIAAFLHVFHPAAKFRSPSIWVSGGNPPAGHHVTLFVPLVGGILGAFVDSLLGATVQGQWLDPASLDQFTEKPIPGTRPTTGLAAIGNDCVNFVCTLTAAFFAWFFC